MRLTLIVLISATLLAGCATTTTPSTTTTGSTTSSTTTTTTATASTTTSTPPPTPFTPADVVISGFAFAPAAFDALVGATVSWTNHDAVDHTVTADNGDFDSGPLAQGAHFAFTLPKNGTIPYHCKIHPTMKGNVTAHAPPSSTTTSTTTTTTPPPSSTLVTIQGFAFHPATLTVTAGTTVTWQNGDGTGHTATSDGGAFASGTLREGDAFSFTFASPGTFPYHCAIHASMKGTIIVT